VSCPPGAASRCRAGRAPSSDEKCLALPRAKAGARHVVLSKEAQEILAKQLASHESDWVFPNPYGRPYSRVRVSRAWREAARGVGLQDFRFHDLRHHGATIALNAGFTAPVVMALGGWNPTGWRRVPQSSNATTFDE
jgi:integrase